MQSNLKTGKSAAGCRSNDSSAARASHALWRDLPCAQSSGNLCDWVGLQAAGQLQREAVAPRHVSLFRSVFACSARALELD